MLPVGLSLVTWITLALTPPAPVQSGGPIGTNYCGPASFNSTGQSGVMSAFGSPLVTANDVTLVASNLPYDFGYFLSSRAQGWLPSLNGGNAVAVAARVRWLVGVGGEVARREGLPSLGGPAMRV